MGSMTHLVFDDRSATQFNDRMVVEDRIVNFITRFLFLHDGPIHKFSLSSSFLQSSPDIDQWLLFISRKDVKELVLELGRSEWFRAPSCVFSCKNLMRNTLNKSSSCNFDKFLGGVPKLERLIGHIYFTKTCFGCLNSLIFHFQYLTDCEFSESESTANLCELCTICKLIISWYLQFLNTVKLTDVSGVPHEMKFIKFLLEHSPSLEEMSITPSLYVTEGRLNMLIDLVIEREKLRPY
ncbi:F-box/FBD/LRR-repeat protein [Sesamum angolense]|uniref:F-box/FBD/LRR-repeat protein n=1 Tax=Sesamum angolense TaxID=2727404 RepID=A0AAE2C634_9LAMI|nr:F-box/FBD/LRR-repeat protein [Sesamum angolense]